MDKTTYKVIARKYRPQTFADVIGQDIVVTTLTNALKNDHLAHAYLFCGCRGTGKTTLARILAKALNCSNPSDNHEPCNQCSSCHDIISGNSLDVLEIDGASNRGIDAIRQINETVSYSSSQGKYKIYIIDEVHMLTKEAFNALLKTLEEPPKNVKFFFATTEPHKVLPTIMSRCQRFNLSRISPQDITSKLRAIANDLSLAIDDDALQLIAAAADGGLRDAESLLDQIIAFSKSPITSTVVADILGLISKSHLFDLDQAVADGNLPFAFELTEQILSAGKDIIHFIETLTEHYRNLLLIKAGGAKTVISSISSDDFQKYQAAAKNYSKDQCLYIVELLLETQKTIPYTSSKRIALEMVLLNIIRSKYRIPLASLVQRLMDIEDSISNSSVQNDIEQSNVPVSPKPEESPSIPQPQNTPVIPQVSSSDTNEYNKNSSSQNSPKTKKPSTIPQPQNTPVAQQVSLNDTKEYNKKSTPPTSPKPKESSTIPQPPIQNNAEKQNTSVIPQVSSSNMNKYDNTLYFAAVELEGTISK